MSSNAGALVAFVATWVAIVAAFIFVKGKRSQDLAAAAQSLGFSFPGTHVDRSLTGALVADLTIPGEPRTI